MTEILVVKKEKGDKVKVKITEKQKNNWMPNKYLKIIPNKDFNQLAYLFYDLHSFGYNIEKAYKKFKEFLNEPELFFLK